MNTEAEISYFIGLGFPRKITSQILAPRASLHEKRIISFPEMCISLRSRKTRLVGGISAKLIRPESRSWLQEGSMTLRIARTRVAKLLSTS